MKIKNVVYFEQEFTFIFLADSLQINHDEYARSGQQNSRFTGRFRTPTYNRRKLEKSDGLENLLEIAWEF